MTDIRVRFAPSPTGYLHIGGARTALFNWLFARHNNGRFILRIEDTDRGRLKEDSVEQIISSMKWLGLDWDEGPDVGGDYGPYFQSQRLDLYSKEIRRLLDEDKAYYCYCTQEELEQRRQQAIKEGKAPRYDGRCRSLTVEEQQSLQKQGRKPVVRLKVPSEGVTVVEDVIRGTVTFDNALLDDFIIQKSDGMPTYNFVCAVDDHAMEISHVIRAEEHLSNTPKQLLVYQALGHDAPVFAHVPMILAPDRSKLSKRHGATSVEEFRDQGYLPEAIVNYLALLGWSPEGDQEMISIEECVKQFDLAKVSKNAAVYDTKKLTWLNGNYIRSINIDSLVDLSIPFMWQKGLLPEQISPDMRDYLKRVVAAVRERTRTLVELADACSYFLTNDFEFDAAGVKKHFLKEGVAELLEKGRSALQSVDKFDAASTEAAYRSLIDELGIKGSDIIHPTRLAISGRTVGPGLFDIMELLGKERTLDRMARAIEYIKKLA
ncbi:MAG: nondiscriminating glutamyl-tRNA synthetase [Clostridiales bacterium]|nr:nondiscriminating glutamyl-tRNA synthetase [Clostridiales bacterium]